MNATNTKEELKRGEWRKLFDERQQKEIELAELYAKDFHHGTTGHNALMIIAKMASLLDRSS